MNIERLLAVRKKIEENPTGLDMGRFHGTHCRCIFGWAEMMFAEGGWLETLGEMANIVGLSYEDAHRLMYQQFWPIHLQEEYLKAHLAKDRDGMAAVTCAAIDEFIAFQLDREDKRKASSQDAEVPEPAD